MRDQLGDSVAEIDVVDVESWESVDEFVAGDHGAARRQDALGVRVTLRVRQRLDHVAHDHVGRIEAERRRVADVQLEDAVALGLQPRGVSVHRAADLVEDVLELGRLRECTLPRLMTRGMPGQLMSGHVNHGAMAVNYLCGNGLISASPADGHHGRCPVL